ncbi:MAG: glycosyltransferase family 2 protein [Candidatus Latescibacteria bacterium]|nr:glycosyltransferase family 2 protein [Candidatus Latescibacterota bacterium]
MPNTSKIPLATIVLTTYNRPNYILKAVTDVFNQTWQNLELIVVDDCSPGQDTYNIVRSISDKRLKYIRREKNGGVSAARNTGIIHAQGDYLAFYDDDDMWEPVKIEKQIALFITSKTMLGAVGCGRIDHLYNRKEIKMPEYRGNIFIDLLARRASGYGGPNIMIPRFTDGCFPLFDESFPALEDLEYAIRIAEKYPVDYVQEALVHVYRYDNLDHVWNSPNVIIGFRKLEQKYSLLLQSHPEILAFYRYHTAKNLLNLGKKREARNDIVEGIKFKPTSGKLYIWYCLSFFGKLGIKIAGRIFAINPPRVH